MELNQRFTDYVNKTSRPAVREQRAQLLGALTGWTCTSVRELCASVGGNTNIRKWIAQAVADGEIVLHESGTYRLPPPEQGDALDQLFIDALGANRRLKMELLRLGLLPTLVSLLRQAEGLIDDHRDPMPEDSEPPNGGQEYDPEKDFEGDETEKQWAARMERNR